MLFTSPSFAVLVAVALLFYYAPPLRRYQRAVLIAASWVFYASNQPALLALLIGSIAINVAASHQAAYGSPGRRRTAAVLGVTANLLLLGFFKYGPLAARTFLPEGTSLGTALLSLPLPVGISFYTFQGITLVVDAFQDRAGTSPDVRTHAWNTTLFVSFFAHLVAGPIVKAHHFLPQIAPKRLADVDGNRAFTTLVIGYFLKMVVADNLSDLTTVMDAPARFQSTLSLVAMLYGYSMQIFADFAGYSLIAIGLAALFGYQFPENFAFPYLADSFAEFWRRWHISLSTFLRDYLYRPLGGNRVGEGRRYLNLFLVMFLGGLWHGAAWSYAIWGTFHGVLLAVERLLGERIRLPAHPLVTALRTAFVFLMVTLGWLLFRLPDHTQVASYLVAVANNRHFEPDHERIFEILLYSAPVLLYHAQHAAFAARGRRFPPALVPWVLGTLLALLVLERGPSAPFIYFQF